MCALSGPEIVQVIQIVATVAVIFGTIGFIVWMAR